MPHESLPITFDATEAGIVIDATHLGDWGGTDPSGRVLDANNYYLTLDGEPFPVVSGEFIPQRYPANEWADALRALRDGGCSMVSSYVFWGQVEPRAGEFDFTGSNDIRRVAELCAELGLLFAPRIGPFNNSEFLLGGLPPWLYGMPLVERSNDTLYLDRVHSYFVHLAAQLEGLYFADGGPIVMVQLENELSHAPNDWRTLFGYTATDNRGPEAGDFAAHMKNLRASAISAGITPPFFAMTAWGLPDGVEAESYIPTYGAYMDLVPQPGGNSILTTFQGGEYPYRGRFPTAFCEIGTGSPARAAYRPMTPPESTLTTAVTRLASIESIFLGYYLYHGGTNPVRGDGFGWTTKEPAFTQRSYDFWAPVSEFGERRETFHRAIPLNRFVLEFGAELAHTQVIEPSAPVLDPDEDRLRAILRACTDGGFIFLSNYGDKRALSDRDDVKVQVALAAGTLVFPRRTTLRIPSGYFMILPVGLSLGAGLTLASSTAQPFARLGSAVEPVIVFHAAAGSDVEYTIAGVDASAIEGQAAVFEETDGATAVVRVDGARRFTVRSQAGLVTILTLPTEHAENATIVSTDGQRRLVTSDTDVSWVDDTVELSRLVPIESGPTDVVLRAPVSATDIPVPLPAPSFVRDSLRIDRLSDSRVLLRVADDLIDVSDLWIDIAYTGDLARMFDANTGLLIGDDFSRGIPWRVRLGRFESALRGAGVQIRVEPLSTRIEVPDDDGILLDHTEQTEGEARIDDLLLLQSVSAAVALGSIR